MSESSVELERAVHVPLPPSVSSLGISEIEQSCDQEQYELQDLGLIDFAVSVQRLPQRNVSALGPTDGGSKAWSFLVAAFMVEGVVWAFPSSFGVLLTAYLRETKLTSQSNALEILPLIGTFSSGFMYCSGPVIYPLLYRYPKLRRHCIYAGLPICSASLFGASYATKVLDLLILQGLLYAIGGSLLYAPCISYMSEWFVRKRGFANGIMFAGTALGGLFLPIVMPILVNTYGASKTLRILSISVPVLILPGVPFLRPRLPENRVHGPGSRSTPDDAGFRSWMWNPTFVFSILANTLQGFAYFLPLLWLPTFASELNLSDTQSSLVVALLNGMQFSRSFHSYSYFPSFAGASALSLIGMGTLADRFNPWLLALLTTLCTSFATFVLWGVLSRDFTGVLAYGISYGALAGGWSSLFSGFIRSLAKDNPTRSTSLFGIFLLTRGIGNVLSTPISTTLSNINSLSTATGNLTSTPYSSREPTLGFEVADGRYAKMIVYVGTCFAGAGVIAALGWGSDAYGKRTHRK